jgi:hypothetical protein
MAVRTLTIRWVETVTPGPVRIEYPDRLLPGLFFIVQPSGHKSWAVRYRSSGRRSRKFTLGPYPLLTLAKARELGREAILAAKQGRDPAAEHKAARRKAEAAAADTLQAIAEEYLAREGRKLRTAKQRRATLQRLVYPKLGDRPIGEIKRSEIIRLLDHIEDERGPRMADVTLGILSRIMSWHSIRDGEFRSPIVRGMARTSQGANARSRILDDAELYAVWNAAKAMPGAFGALVQFILLTATRRSEAAHMRHSEVNGRDWLIPAARYKGKHDHLVPLSSVAFAIISEMPAFSDWVFVSGTGRPITDFARYKQILDQASGVTGWRLHDLRRTSRSLMSRAGVNADIAERCLGHVIGGVRGIYDRHAYHREKMLAFEALATQIEQIIIHPVDNVTALRRECAR